MAVEISERCQSPNIAMFGGMNFFPDIPRPFNTQYRCYPVAMMPGGERSDVEAGGKIIMPPSALDQLTRSTENTALVLVGESLVHLVYLEN